VYQQQEQQQEQQDAEKPFLDPPFSRIKINKNNYQEVKLSKSCQKVVKKLSKSCQKVVKKLSKSCQSCQKIVKNVVAINKSQNKVNRPEKNKEKNSADYVAPGNKLRSETTFTFRALPHYILRRSKPR
jgi:tetrahydrodipicolinate N-succinyltransferase